MSGSYELSPRNFAGDLLTLVAGLLYGGYLIFVERARTKLQPMPLLILATLFSIPVLLLDQPRPWRAHHSRTTGPRC